MHQAASWERTMLRRSQLPDDEISQSNYQPLRMLMHLEQGLSRYAIDQDRAISQVARSIGRRVALGPPERLLGAFYFVGPGSDQKEGLARGLATALFGAETAIHHLDMTEFAERGSGASLIGYNGMACGLVEGRLTEPVRQ